MWLKLLYLYFAFCLHGIAFLLVDSLLTCLFHSRLMHVSEMIKLWLTLIVMCPDSRPHCSRWRIGDMSSLSTVLSLHWSDSAAGPGQHWLRTQRDFNTKTKGFQGRVNFPFSRRPKQKCVTGTRAKRFNFFTPTKWQQGKVNTVVLAFPLIKMCQSFYIFSVYICFPSVRISIEVLIGSLIL